jgi:anthranilate phosphoribosyltransferase
MRIAMIDNYDSFTYNLVQYLAELGAEVEVVRNDAVSASALLDGGPAGVVISPGPGDPDTAGISLDAVRACVERRVPLLGVCLGHQSIGAAFGGKIVRARKIMHGKVSIIDHDGKGVFAGIDSPFAATRYHSLVIEESSCPAELEITARTADREIMAVRHRSLPIEGVQFHPESILTACGKQLLGNFLTRCAPGRCMSVASAIERAVRGEELPPALIESAFAEIAAGEANPVAIAALLAALRTKGETVGEIVGAARALRAAGALGPCLDPRTVDTCGTGGDGAHTFNISTTPRSWSRAAGVPVAKHGNRAASSKSGSIDVLEALGVAIELDVEASGRVLAKVGIAPFFARIAHPAMRHVAPVRQALGIRTLMNCMGPLLNPLGVRRQVIGVYDRALVPTLAAALAQLGSARVLVVHGSDGLDEVTITGPDPCRAARERRGARVLDRSAGARRRARVGDALRGGDAAENAAIALTVLEGEVGPRRDVVLLNAAAALWVAGARPTSREGSRSRARGSTRAALARSSRPRRCESSPRRRK